MIYEIFVTDSGIGYGFKIISEKDHINIVQICHPEKEGFVEMTQEEAETLAARYLLNIGKSSEEENVATVSVSQKSSQIGQV